MGDLRDRAYRLLCALVLEDGRRWGEAAVSVQHGDALQILDPDSLRPYAFLTRARGYAKTSDLAGLLIAIMLTHAPPGARLYWLAADAGQGRLALDSIAGYLARTPELRGALDVQASRVVVPSTNVVLEVIAADAPSSYGLRPFVLTIDERSVFTETDGVKRLLEATTSAVAKVKDARMIIITSAGDPAHSSHRELEVARADPLWFVHEVPGPPPWIDPQRLAEQKRRLLPSAYSRLFENRWTAAEDRLATLDDVRACVSHEGPLEPRPGVSYVVSLDVGLKRDATAVVVAHAELRDGRAVVVVDRVDAWTGSRDRPLDLSMIEEQLALRCSRYGAPLVFDPYQAASTTQRLRARGVRTIEFTFSSASVGRLAQTLFNLLRERALALPDDEGLLDELVNVRLRETAPGAYRIDHDPTRHDDRVIALALAAQHLVAAGIAKRARWINPASLSLGDLGTTSSRRTATLRYENGSTRLVDPVDPFNRGGRTYG